MSLPSGVSPMSNYKVLSLTRRGMRATGVFQDQDGQETTTSWNIDDLVGFATWLGLKQAHEGIKGEVTIDTSYNLETGDVVLTVKQTIPQIGFLKLE